MLIKQLKIEDNFGLIRDIRFHKGVNLIVDNTVGVTEKETGNSVGKTTVLTLIDFCLGADPKLIYTDQETKKEIEIVKSYLIENKVLITLTLTDSFDDIYAREIIIERNFLNNKHKIIRINGEKIKDKEFESKLDDLIIGDRSVKKPTFREIISHSIRYTDDRINNTLKVLTKFNSLPEYETLYLYLFGITTTDRSQIFKKMKSEIVFKNRLEKKQSKTEFELSLAMVQNTINKVELKKNSLNLNPNFEENLNDLNETKYQISLISSKISELSIRRDLIHEAEMELKEDQSNIDLIQLKRIYEQANNFIPNLQKTFEDLVSYHNKMIVEKIRFISQELPEIYMEINKLNEELNILLSAEVDLINKVTKSDTFSDLEKIISDLNENYRQKGEIENSITQIKEIEKKITDLEDELKIIDHDAFSIKSQEKIKNQLVKFNEFFSDVSNELYNETYGITYGIKTDKKTGKNVYDFHCFNDNNSSGKKQGEILCFDLAYILFADKEEIPVLHFILNDKKELMHINQLIKVAKYIEGDNIQLIFSILKDKLPNELNTDNHIVLRLSQQDKLFKIENRFRQ
ncbi:DUF2326 domain-containing protein [Paenibacillus sp. Leaf72]|uniref:DUF2326 domain-containing protein n=1 Tax=Paenibacillus sp. Leaf72 TaxID=1736234 RepID=UPI0006FA0344|nr:DUF2326 domain-containing protein [Paenibacillus sp. Leaf72]KQO18051.1 hypothetical protein ASF12_05240 [Paenibacillus sp. Leaf72]